MIIPLYEAGCPHVTHPSAAKIFKSKLLNISARLACVKHAASVHPEPGSNSYVKILCQLTLTFFVSIYYLVVYLNLNKLVIDLGLIFYHQLFSFQGSILFLLTVSPDSLFIIHYFVSFVNTFFRLFLKSFVISNSFKSVFIG